MTPKLKKRNRSKREEEEEEEPPKKEEIDETNRHIVDFLKSEHFDKFVACVVHDYCT